MEVLSAEDKKAILKALEEAAELRKELAKAKRAGIDVSVLEAELQEAVVRLTNLKNVYIKPGS